MGAVSLDGSYSEQIKNEVWTAIENMERFSYPWVVIEIGSKPVAKIFGHEEVARRYAARIKKRLPKKTKIICIEASYYSTLKPVSKPTIKPV